MEANGPKDVEPETTEKASAEADAALREEGLTTPTAWERREAVRLARLYRESCRSWAEAMRLAAISVAGPRVPPRSAPW